MEDLSNRNITVTSSTRQKHLSSENTAAGRLKRTINKQAG